MQHQRKTQAQVCPLHRDEVNSGRQNICGNSPEAKTRTAKMLFQKTAEEVIGRKKTGRVISHTKCSLHYK